MDLLRKMAFIVGLLTTISSSTVSASGPNRTKYLDGFYLMGVDTLAEYDYYAVNYPGIFHATPTISLLPNGTADLEVITGTYTKTKNYNKITVMAIAPPTSSFTFLEYRFYKISGSSYWGEIYFDGNLYGIMRVNMH